MKVTKYNHFMWRDRKGRFHNPENMETRHVFFVLRMIWNYNVPKTMQIKPFKHYKFNPFYTKEYMKLAIRTLLYELAKRDDLTPYFKKCLDLMCNHRKMITN